MQPCAYGIVGHSVQFGSWLQSGSKDILVVVVHVLGISEFQCS